MRFRADLALILLLPACQAAPDIMKINADAQAKLQRELDSSYGAGRATARSVELIATAAPRFEGSATVLIDGTKVILPITVMADGKTTIITSDHARVGELIARQAAGTNRAANNAVLPHPASRQVPQSANGLIDEAALDQDDCSRSPPKKQTPSLDGGYVYLQVCRWATSDLIVQVRLSDGHRKEVGPGNTLAVIRNGPYRGYLLLARHKYDPRGGSYDSTYVVRPDGVEALEIPGSAKDDRAVQRWLTANGWRAS